MNRLTKRRIRNIVIAAAIVAAVVFGISRISFAPANYREQLMAQITAAEAVLDADAQDGSEEEQELRDAADAGRAIIDDENSQYDTQKEAADRIAAALEDYEAAGSADMGVAANGDNTDFTIAASDEATAGMDSGGSDVASSEAATDTAGESEMTVSITIECTSLTGDGEAYITDDGIRPYIGDGYILRDCDYTCGSGSTVYDVLSGVCTKYGIHMDHSYSGLYSSEYIQGINYIYEKDAGKTSGWMYSVNGTSPNYGCNSYKVNNGDEILWYYVTGYR